MFRITKPLYHKNDNQIILTLGGVLFSRVCTIKKLINNNKFLLHLRVFKNLYIDGVKLLFANTVTLYLMSVIGYKNTTVKLEIAQVLNLNL